MPIINLEDLETYKLITSFNTNLPPNRLPYKDTLNYMIIQNSKVLKYFSRHLLIIVSSLRIANFVLSEQTSPSCLTSFLRFETSHKARLALCLTG